MSNTELSLLSAFLIGLAGSVHCVGMCGGIVSAFTLTVDKHRSHWPFTLAYNTGRIASYTLIGALAGAFGASFSHFIPQGAKILTFISGVFLLLLGLYIGGWWRILTRVEHAGSHLWRHIQPLSKRLLPLSHPAKALPYGMVWGWLPCGLVYSTASWSIASGSWLTGALIMLMFGVGTLPALFTLSASTQSFRSLIVHPLVRQLIAACLVIFALLLLLKPFLG